MYRGVSYTQIFSTPVKYVEKWVIKGDKFYIQSNDSQKNQIHSLKNRGGYAKIIGICQNELINHTLVTALVRTVFVRVLLLKLDVPS